MSDESIINLSDETKALIRNNAMIAGFMVIFIFAAIMLVTGLSAPSPTGGETMPGDATPPEGSGKMAGLGMVHVIAGILMLLISVILAMLHKRDQIAITFMIMGMTFAVTEIGSILFQSGNLDQLFIPLNLCVLFMGIMLLFTRNEQRYISALILIPYGLLHMVAPMTDVSTENTLQSICSAILVIVSLYAVLCLGIDRIKLPGRDILTADEDDETNDGSPVHFKVTGAVLGYMMFMMAMIASVFYYHGWFNMSIEAAFTLETVGGFMLILTGIIMLVVGRMKFTPFLFIMLGTVTSMSAFITDIGQISFVFYLVIGILCLFRSDRRVLVGIAIILYGCTYLISAMYGGTVIASLSIALNFIPIVILLYVCLALCSDNRLKLI